MNKNLVLVKDSLVPKAIPPHEYLEEEMHYEANSVGTRAHSDYTCEHCGQTIVKGTPHLSHKFYPEFSQYRTHNECEEGFMISLEGPTRDAYIKEFEALYGPAVFEQEDE